MPMFYSLFCGKKLQNTRDWLFIRGKLSRNLHHILCPAVFHLLPHWTLPIPAAKLTQLSQSRERHRL
jgi:hypothetical protein